MSDDLVKRLRDTSHSVILSREAADRIEALQAELVAAVDALYAVELEYDPSEDGQNALIMYEIASDAMEAIRARSNKEPGQ